MLRLITAIRPHSPFNEFGQATLDAAGASSRFKVLLAPRYISFGGALPWLLEIPESAPMRSGHEPKDAPGLRSAWRGGAYLSAAGIWEQDSRTAGLQGNLTLVAYAAGQEPADKSQSVNALTYLSHVSGTADEETTDAYRTAKWRNA